MNSPGFLIQTSDWQKRRFCLLSPASLKESLFYSQLMKKKAFNKYKHFVIFDKRH